MITIILVLSLIFAQILYLMIYGTFPRIMGVLLIGIVFININLSSGSIVVFYYTSKIYAVLLIVCIIYYLAKKYIPELVDRIQNTFAELFMFI